jgi:hypothetical protein
MSARDMRSSDGVSCAPSGMAETVERPMKAQAAETTEEGFKASRETALPTHRERAYFYCAQPHELDEILLLNRWREMHKRG